MVETRESTQFQPTEAIFLCSYKEEGERRKVKKEEELKKEEKEKSSEEEKREYWT